MSEANKVQVAGTHYVKHGQLQHWDVVAHFDLNYFQGQITRYVFRYRDKNGIQDLLKARHYIDKLIELEEVRLKTGHHVGPGVAELLGTAECSAEEPPRSVPKIVAY